ncbi:hypothetical protein QCA50_009733 [Cerrena zonata]|uniref:Uncharacterized protein n=1 Tax=Cerrena zonata TaxID=2478898 RepID=A0AAW0GBC1_9APHY
MSIVVILDLIRSAILTHKIRGFQTFYIVSRIYLGLAVGSTYNTERTNGVGLAKTNQRRYEQVNFFLSCY